jgi:hypothetical protein
MKEATPTLLISSFALLAPTWTAYRKNKYIATMTALCFATSTNYWRHPVYGARRTVDVIVVRITAVLTFLYGYKHSAGVARKIGYGCTFLSMTGYASSWYLHARGNGLWVASHALVHVVSSVGMVMATI